MNAKELIGNFVPMDEGEQKDFLLILLDGIDHYDELIKTSKKKDKMLFFQMRETYFALADFFLKNEEIEKIVGTSSRAILRNYAKDLRRKYEAEKEGKKA